MNSSTVGQGYHVMLAAAPGRCGKSASPGTAAELEPPTSNTGAKITIHWLRGGFEQAEDDVLELVNDLTEGGYLETFNWGRFMYRKHAVFVGGLCVYSQPVASNMPAVLVECPGSACEMLGHEKLQVLFCNAELSRVDIAYDYASFTPLEVAGWIEAGNIRTRAKDKNLYKSLVGRPGDTVTVGSRGSEQYLRIYDERGFTRVELELKGKAARAFKLVLLELEPSEFVRLSVGALRSFVDFVDASADSNISRAPLLEVWAAFTEGLERVQLRVLGKAVDSLEGVADWIEHQVSSMLWVYHRSGRSVGELLRLGRDRMGTRHRRLLAMSSPAG